MAKIGIAGYPIWNDEQTQLLGFAIPVGNDFQVYNTVGENIGSHYELNAAAALLQD